MVNINLKRGNKMKDETEQKTRTDVEKEQIIKEFSFMASSQPDVDLIINELKAKKISLQEMLDDKRLYRTTLTAEDIISVFETTDKDQISKWIKEEQDKVDKANKDFWK